jgi:hypothetical protein
MMITPQPKSITEGVYATNSRRLALHRFLIGGIIILLILLTALPIAYFLYILATTGSNNLSNDYARILPLIDQILSGNYDWSFFIKDSFIVSHFQPIPILIHLLNAKLTGWNVYFELYCMVLLSVVRLFLSYQALTSLYINKIRILWLPVISLLVFSISQISNFEFGFVSVQVGLSVFGITLGVWGLVKFKKTSLALLIMVAGGILASWTSASGIMVWLAFLLGMILLGHKKILYYLVWLVTCVLVNFPYLYFLVLDRKQGVNATLQGFFNPRLVINILGRPFASGIGKTTGFLLLGEAAGWIGIIFGIIGLILIIIYRKSLLKASSPAIMLMTSGLLAAWQTSIFRVLIAPWYTSMVIGYWIGLVGLAYLLAAYAFSKNREFINGHNAKMLIPVIYSVGVMVFMTSFYLKTNLTYRDKTFFMASRSPTSAACLRHYEWAPTYCERFVFQWPVNRVFLEDFAWPLQHHNLSVFSSRQQWAMQGDMILGKVYSPESPNTLGVEWYDDLPGTLSPFTDHRHLNLRVAPSRSINWEVRIPENLLVAELSSGIGVGSTDQDGEISRPVTYEIYLIDEGTPKELVYSEKLDNLNKRWLNFKLDLLPFQGREITLHFTVQDANNSLISLYRFPTINLVSGQKNQITERPMVQPLNTGLSSKFPKMTPVDYIFNLEGAELHGLVPVNDAVYTWKVTAAPYISATLKQPVNLADFGWISFSISASPDIPSRATRVNLYFEGKEEPISILVPLMKDGVIYTYSYPLRMLDIPGRLVKWQLNPVLLPSGRGENRIRLEDFRLIHLP